MDPIIELDIHAQERLNDALVVAVASGRKFRIAIDGTEVKWKVGEGSWTPGYGRLDPTSGYAQRIARLAEEAKERLGYGDPEEPDGETLVAAADYDRVLAARYAEGDPR